MTPRLRKENAAYVEVPGEPLLELHRKSGIFYVRKVEKGRPPLFKSLRTKNISAARKLALEAVTVWKARAPGLRPQKLKIAELCELLFQELKEEAETLDEHGRPQRRPGTFGNDRRFLHDETIRGKLRPGKLKELFGDRFPDEVDENFWKTWCKRTGKKRFKRLGDIAKYLSHVMDYAHRNNYIARKPTFANPDRHSKKAVVYTPAQIRAFWKHAEPLLRDLIVINSENPFRPLETPYLPWSMVHFEMGAQGEPIVIVRLEAHLVKNEESARELQVSPNAAAVFTRLRGERLRALPSSAQDIRTSRMIESPWVFPSPKDPRKHVTKKTLNRMWHRMLARAGLGDSGYLFKWLRHSLYTRLLVEEGLPVAAVSAVGGTSMRTLSKHYLDGDARRTAIVGQAVSHNFEEEE